MAEREKIVQAVYRAIDEVNQMRPPEERVPKALETPLSGPSSVLDSLGTVNFLVEAEQQVEAEFGVPVNLSDQKAMSQEINPLATVGTLVEYINLCLRGTGDG
jgi:hypothetical protein